MIGTRITEIRSRLGLRSSEFADKLGISRGYLHDVEKGTKNVGLQLLLQLHAVFHVSADWVLFGVGTPFLLPTIPTERASHLSIYTTAELLQHLLQRSSE